MHKKKKVFYVDAGSMSMEDAVEELRRLKDKLRDKYMRDWYAEAKHGIE